MCDKVGGALELTRRLVEAKRKYPHRVFFVVGNRDLNKLRLLHELSHEAMVRLEIVEAPYPARSWLTPASPPQASEPPIPYGTPKNCKPYSEFLVSLGVAAKLSGVAEGAPLPPQAWAELNTKANRLRWILDFTMGAQGDFERRREELKRLQRVSDISDDQVVASYLEAVSDGGYLLEYLRKGSLAVGINGTLFLHGGLVHESYAKNAEKNVVEQAGSFKAQVVTEGGFEVALGCVPGVETRYTDANAWIAKLNIWLQTAVERTLRNPAHPAALMGQQYATYGAAGTSGPSRASPEAHTRAAPLGLRGPHLRTGSWPSVITSRHLNSKSQPTSMPPSVSSALLQAGYFRLVIGHTPVGSCPTVVPGNVQVVMADTSYSDFKAPDNRGSAGSVRHCAFPGACDDLGRSRSAPGAPQVVEIEGERLDISGRLPDGSHIAYTVFQSADGSVPSSKDHDSLIGRGKFDDWWIKARLAPADPPRYLVCHVEGFKYEYRVEDEQQARKLAGL